MPPVGHQVRHSEHVAVGCIRAYFSPCGLHRYALVIPYRGECDRSLFLGVVLKNPSSADANRADQTIRRVEEYIYQCFPYACTLVVVNLFALRATKTKDLADHITQHGVQSATGAHNDDAVAHWLWKCSDVVLAWGGTREIDATVYHDRIRAVVDLLGEHPGRMWTVGHPLHGLRWKKSDPASPLNRLAGLPT